jgi:hypothetical protein
MKHILTTLITFTILLGCVNSPQLQQCNVEMNVLLDNGIERTIIKPVKLRECTMTTANRGIFLNSSGHIRYIKPNHIGSSILLNNVNYFEIISVEPK